MFWSIFAGSWQRASLRSLKWLPQKEAKNHPEIFFQRVGNRVHPEEMFWFDGYNFWSNKRNGKNITENCFAPKNEKNTAKLSFSGEFWSIFDVKLTKNFFLRSNKWISQKEAKNHQESYFFSTVWKGANPKEKIWIDGNNFFFAKTCEKGQILPKTFLVLKIWNIKHFLQKSTQNSLCHLKSDYIRRKLRIAKKMFFSMIWNRVNPEEMFWIDGNDIFLVKQVKCHKYYRKCFAPQNEAHTAKLSFCGVLKHFRRNWHSISERS